MIAPPTRPNPTEEPLARRERQVLLALIETSGRVAGRHELARLSGLSDLNDRRCDSILVGLRRHLPEGAIRTVRKRGWVLDPTAVPAARSLLTDSR